ncbi:toprim domain-containing protein [Halomonas sp. TRM85114]|uniref:toprim domain-containing protein n=1 Tax=Halomonas jincaotanensis TaxID=2810616 RepID=UPI001BD24E73|nr:toprim domain-containing protein [Halomonas jincaotanensis]MBS9404931.1 toprim domain-containing protein [Halomonas jincaotanensis]
MIDYKKAPGCGGRARLDSVIEMDQRHHTIDSALLLAVRELYGIGISLQGRGQWQRFKPPGKRDLDGYAAILGHEAAMLGRWDTGEQHLVVLADEQATDEERANARREAQQQVQVARERQQAALSQQHSEAAERARALWGRALPAQEHPYLLRKDVAPGWARQLGHLLLVPLTDGTQLVNVQTIATDGTKRFLTGGRKKGCYHPIGQFDTGRPLLICEGWATGMTLHAATGSAVACAMDAGNLLPVARYLHRRYPDARIIIAADYDYDHGTEGNPGIMAGQAAGAAVGGRCIWPTFSEGAEGTDFNDLAAMGGEVSV